jgi:hypothetical protein
MSKLIFFAKIKGIILECDKQTKIYDVYPNVDNIEDIKSIGTLYVDDTLGNISSTTDTVINQKYTMSISDGIDNYVFNWKAEIYVNGVIKGDSTIYLNSQINLTTTNKYASYYSYNVNLDNSNSPNILIKIESE